MNDIFDLNLTKEDGSLNDEALEKYSKIIDELNLNSVICISNSFELFLKDFINSFKKVSSDLMNFYYFKLGNNDENKIARNSQILSITKTKLDKILSLFYNLYNLYYNKKEKEKDFAEILVLHNNIKAFSYILNFFIKMDFLPRIYKNILLSNYSNEEKIDKENLLNEINLPDEIENLLMFVNQYDTKFGEFEEVIMSKIISNFLQNLSEEFSTVENFEELRYDRKYKKADKMFKNCNEYFVKFFDYFHLFANEKDFFFNLNYSLSLFFDVLNKKILSIKDFSVDDLVATSNFLKTNSAELKKGLENIVDQNQNSQFKLKYSNILDINQKYKKFEEIIFILNSGLKDIKNLVINSNRKLNIDPNELVGLIEAIFEQSDFKTDVINIVFQYLKK